MSRFSAAGIGILLAILFATTLFVVRPSIGYTTFTAESRDRQDGDIQIRRPYYPVPREINWRFPLHGIGWRTDPHAYGSRVKSHKLDNGSEVLAAKFVVNQALSDQTLAEVVLAIRFNDKVFEYDAVDLLSHTGTSDSFSPIGVFSGKFYIFALNISAPTGKSGAIGAIEWPPRDGSLNVVHETDEMAWNGVLSEISTLSPATIQSLRALKLKSANRFPSSINAKAEKSP